MSSVYSVEPKTKGKLILHTTHGAIEIYLWSDECPKSCRNIIQHSLNGYYDNLPFHRIVPEVLIQTGDPSGTGHGGICALSSHGKSGLMREVHGRLKFRRRGICALVADENGECRSQFFITLSETPWLDGSHSIFGAVNGNTIFNVLNLSAFGELDNAFDVEDVPRIKSVEVLDNPFPQLKKDVALVQNRVGHGHAKNSGTNTTGKKAVRNRKLLSFGDELNEVTDEDYLSDRFSRANIKAKHQTVAKAVRSQQRSGTISIRSESRCTTSASAVKAGPSKALPGVQKSIDKTTKSSSRKSVYSAAEAEYARLKNIMRAKLNGKNAPATSNPQKKTSTQPGIQATPKETELNAPQPRRKRKMPAEAESLQRLKLFEERLKKARRSLKAPDNSGDSGKIPWFSQPLSLPEPAGIDANFGIDTREAGRKQRKT